MLYGVRPGDPVAFLLAALVLIAVAAVASALPGLRAAHMDPVKILELIAPTSRTCNASPSRRVNLVLDEIFKNEHWPVLEKDDAGLKNELEKLLTARAVGNPYTTDGSFAESIASLPPGLRAMAATHWLDISLTLDSLTWHFGNFGEPHLVAETEAGLHELGLHELALCFAEAKELMVPLLAKRTEADGDPYEILERAGLTTRADELDRRAWALDDLGRDKSLIYEAWIRYARQHPERVFRP